MPASPVIDVALAIIQEAGQVLIARRPAHVPMGGYWEFPGGKCLKGESPDHAVLREVLEETDLQVGIVHALAPIEHGYAGHGVRLFAFVCQKLEGEPKPLGCDELRWVAVSDLNSFRFPPANDRLIAAFKSWLAGNGADLRPSVDT